MAVKATSFRNWCMDNISPQSWPRVLLKSIDALRVDGFQLKDLEDPSSDVILSPQLLEALSKALNEIYDIEIEEGLLTE
jgi:hypothetical protein